MIGALRRGAAGDAVQARACLDDLNRPAEAEKLFQELTQELPTRPQPDQVGWPAHAACKLWLLYLQKRRDAVSLKEKDAFTARADEILARLYPAYSMSELAPLVPAKLRTEILDNFRFRGPIWNSAYTYKDDVVSSVAPFRSRIYFRKARRSAASPCGGSWRPIARRRCSPRPSP